MGEHPQAKRVVSLWVVGLLVILAVAATGVAILTTNVSIQKLSLFQTTFEDTDFVLMELELEIEGKNQIEVELALTNTDSISHEAEVTVQILDAVGDVILQETRSTGSVSAGDHWEAEFVFIGAHLVDHFDNVFIIVDQT